ncbi:DUF3231 family protein [Salipaludibacillus sp. HK11]|uniref:DUF3231 family protein n=1 Tax=Salipaludibacillus sp. HK11 TaxID=3394320 RepID=UPI0039FDD9FA
MYHKSLFSSTSISFYGVAIGTSLRADLTMHFSRLSAELGVYMSDGMDIMIKNKWMEQAPMTEDRKKLVKKMIEKQN